MTTEQLDALEALATTYVGRSWARLTVPPSAVLALIEEARAAARLRTALETLYDLTSRGGGIRDVPYQEFTDARRAALAALAEAKQ